MPQQSRELTDDELRGVFDDPRADLSLLSPEEHRRLLVLTDPDAGGPPAPSVMDERGFVDRAVDYLPAIAGTVASFGGATKRTLPGMAISGAAGAGGELARQGIRLAQGRGEDVPDTAGGALSRAGLAGVSQALSEGAGRGVVHGLRAAAPALMKMGLGAQKSVRDKFPTVDLEDVALREGTLRDPFSRGAIGAKGAQAGAAVSASGRAADAAGTAPIQSAEVIGDLTKLRDRLLQGREPEMAQVVDEYMAALQQKYGQGVNIEDALVRKTLLQNQAKAAIKNPMTGPIGTQAIDAEQSALTRMMHDPQRVPGVGPTLKRAQEMKALEKAGQNLPAGTLRNILGAVVGTGAGGVTGVASGNPAVAAATAAGTMAAQRALTSPTALGRYGIAARRMSEMSKFNPAALGSQAMTRAALLQLLQGLAPE